ncbi:hypothetical protein CERZMDRAFT_102752 [Cercospora zeae-maydis SCOH1-5]|uniref:Uncharacterized protein n=1 Tax=Cercospora zeae-maydis SCOH1-5 TaxID=717836 RepID=A0A6A6EZD3_9PEZI|nr:hypothetical protein CERZMDRAFT_102752 [Cercospora zeae-maydis SCOH1-5]
MIARNSEPRGHLPLFLLLLSIIAVAIFCTASPSDPGLIRRLHARLLDPDLHITVNGLHAFEPRAPKGLVIKPATDAEYNKARIKGHTLMSWMRDPTLAGTQAGSKITRFEQLTESGWTGYGGSQIRIAPNYAGYDDPGLIALLGPAGDTQSRGHKALIQHVEAKGPVQMDGKTYKHPATNANYDNVFNVEKGVIVAEYNWGPKYQVEDGNVKGWNPQTDLLPVTHQLSDVWWLFWARICAQENASPSRLRYIVSHNTVNYPTQQIFARVLQIHWKGEAEVDRGQARGWPGKLITNDMEGFVALIGTPSIWASAYMLIQRSGVMGKKQIKSIRVWNSYPDKAIFYQPSITIELESI